MSAFVNTGAVSFCFLIRLVPTYGVFSVRTKRTPQYENLKKISGIEIQIKNIRLWFPIGVCQMFLQRIRDEPLNQFNPPHTGYCWRLNPPKLSVAKLSLPSFVLTNTGLYNRRLLSW